MARKTEEKVIDGVTYKVTQVGAKEARKVQLRLARVAGALMPLALDGSQGAGALAAVASSLARVMTDEDLALVIDTFANQTLFQDPGAGWRGLPEHYDEHFAGAALRHLRWLRFALEVNFSDFFVALGPAPGAAVSPVL